MNVTIKPGKIKGNLNAPASKSAMQRACALAYLNSGKTTIHNPGTSNDDLAALGIIRSLGAMIFEPDPHSLEITAGKPESNDGKAINIDCGESGLSIRMFAPIAAMGSNIINIAGSGSLIRRPMNFFDEVFPEIGISVKTSNGFLPIQLRGPLKPVNIEIDGSLSSQFLTGILIAFAASAKEVVTVKVKDLKSKPYIDLTLQMLAKFGYKITNQYYEQFIIHPVGPMEKEITYTVEGDWSGAAFLLVAGAIAGEVTVKGLDVFSSQADRAILQVLMAAKANIGVSESSIDVKSSSNLEPFHFDATDCPDLFPPLVALAAYCKGTSVIEGVYRLTHKESNRALTLQVEFKKLGVEIRLQDDLMIIAGGSTLNGASVSSHHDHRIAMALAVAGLCAEGNVIIEDAHAIDKSYPAFFQHLASAGAMIENLI